MMFGKFLNRFLSPFQGTPQNGASPFHWLNQGAKQNFGVGGNPFFDMGQLNDFVQNAINQTMQTQQMYGNFHTNDKQPQTQAQSKSLGKDGPIAYEIVELHQSIIVKIYIPTQIPCQNIQISLQGSRLLLTERNHMFQMKIQLPCTPRTNGIEAKYYEETIEIRLLKLNEDVCTEIDIQF